MRTAITATPRSCRVRSKAASKATPAAMRAPALASRDAFTAIVIDGVRAANGMASFSGVLDADGADAIRAYLIEDANAALPANSAR